MNCIEIKKLNKKYPNFELKDINLEFPTGKIIGLIGENGAGKTTLIKSILNIINYDGEIKIFNKDTKEYDNIIKEDIGVVLDESFFPEILQVKDVNAIMKNIYKTWDSEMFNKYIKEFNIPLNQKIKELSKGMRKKLEIITSLSHNPKLLILDEPTSGLDPVFRSEILDIFNSFITKDKTILLSTHITSDLEKIADIIVFVDNGSIVINEDRVYLEDNYGVVNITEEEFNKIDKKDYIKYKKDRHSYEVLIDKKDNFKKKYKNIKIESATIEDIMVLYIKGEE